MDSSIAAILGPLAAAITAMVGVFIGYRGRVREEQERADRERQKRETAERSAYRRQNVLRRILSWHHATNPPPEYAMPAPLIGDLEEETE